MESEEWITIGLANQDIDLNVANLRIKSARSHGRHKCPCDSDTAVADEYCSSPLLSTIDWKPRFLPLELDNCTPDELQKQTHIITQIKHNHTHMGGWLMNLLSWLFDEDLEEWKSLSMMERNLFSESWLIFVSSIQIGFEIHKKEKNTFSFSFSFASKQLAISSLKGSSGWVA